MAKAYECDGCGVIFNGIPFSNRIFKYKKDVVRAILDKELSKVYGALHIEFQVHINSNEQVEDDDLTVFEKPVELCKKCTTTLIRNLYLITDHKEISSNEFNRNREISLLSST